MKEKRFKPKDVLYNIPQFQKQEVGIENRGNAGFDWSGFIAFVCFMLVIVALFTLLFGNLTSYIGEMLLGVVIAGFLLGLVFIGISEYRVRFRGVEETNYLFAATVAFTVLWVTGFVALMVWIYELF